MRFKHSVRLLGQGVVRRKASVYSGKHTTNCATNDSAKDITKCT